MVVDLSMFFNLAIKDPLNTHFACHTEVDDVTIDG